MAPGRGHRNISSAQSKGGTSSNSPLTHFLCIPLVTEASRPSLKASLLDFRREIRERGFSTDAVRPMGTIHLTIGVMSLLTEEMMENAFQLLKSLELKSLLADQSPKQDRDSKASATDQHATKSKALETTEINKAESTGLKPLSVSLRSLHSMRDPRDTSILYIFPTDPSETLLPLCERLRTIFVDAGLMKSETRDFKLHATVFNGQHARRIVPGRRGKRPLSIDATGLLEKYRDSTWTDDFELEKVSICRMRAEDVHDASGQVVSQEYREVCSVPLPTTSRSEQSLS